MTRRPVGTLSNALLFFALIMAIFSARSCEERRPSPASRDSVSTPVTNPVADQLKPVAPAVPRRDGIAAAILVDTSGSMGERVQEADGTRRQKMEIARRAALNLVKEFDSFARGHSDQVIYVGIYEFSGRERGPSARPVVTLGPPDPAVAERAIAKMTFEGSTPIGDAMILAKRDVDATGLSKRHILVITDGENNRGYSPESVTQVISNLAEEDRASIYFVAFDVAASKFDSVRDSGGLVLAASNESDLKTTLDYLLTGKILVEQPAAR